MAGMLGVRLWEVKLTLAFATSGFGFGASKLNRKRFFLRTQEGDTAILMFNLFRGSWPSSPGSQLLQDLAPN